MIERSDDTETNGALLGCRGVLQFHPSTAETLSQITPQICSLIHDFKEALKLPVRSGEFEHVEQVVLDRGLTPEPCVAKIVNRHKCFR
jgi:hypothetical protein